jgi:hypothetical protein
MRFYNSANGHVFYAPTGGYSTMSTAWFKASTFKFFVPAGMETGAMSLYVVANGIASAPVSVTVN